MELIEPSYYTSFSYQPIDFCIDNFEDHINYLLLGQALKYISRFRNKNGLEDLKKAYYFLIHIRNPQFNFNQDLITRFIDQFDNPEYAIFERLLNNHINDAIILLEDLINDYN